jgi:hypothetical protein
LYHLQENDTGSRGCHFHPHCFASFFGLPGSLNDDSNDISFAAFMIHFSLPNDRPVDADFDLLCCGFIKTIHPILPSLG